MMAFVIIIGVISFLYIKNYEYRKLLMNVQNQKQIYFKEQKTFLNLMIRLSTVPPDGVDGTHWMICVHKLIDEPDVHPLRGLYRNYNDLNNVIELSAKCDALHSINDYLKQRVSNLPIKLESLPIIRDRILRDYDPKVLLVEGKSGENHPENCQTQFNEAFANMLNARQRLEH
jgi:hypothetical protein